MQEANDEPSAAAPVFMRFAGSRRDVSAAASAFLFLFALVSVPLLWFPPAHGLLVPASLVLAGMLAALSAIDLYEHRLPDLLTFPLAAFGLMASAWTGVEPMWWPAASALLGFALLAGVAIVYRRLRGRHGLGLGDAKLMGAAGAWLGAQAIPTVLLWAAAGALLCVGIAYLGGRPVGLSARLPFGPFLAFAIWVVWLYGPI